MNRIALSLLFAGLAMTSITLYVVDQSERRAIAEAFAVSGSASRKAVVEEAARLSPWTDHGREIYAAATMREWLARHPDDPVAPFVRERITRRNPWGYPHPWPWPEADYASEYLASVAELESASRPPIGSDNDLSAALALMKSAVADRPAWEQHRRTLEAVVIASRR